MSRILVLDDEIVRHEIFTKLLVGDVVHTWTVDEAVKALENQDRFDLIYLDHDLGRHPDFSTEQTPYGAVELTGYDVAHFIATKLSPQKRPDKVIVHSWNIPAARLMKACFYDAGIACALLPFDPKTL